MTSATMSKTLSDMAKLDGWTPLTDEERHEFARLAVFNYVKERLDKTDEVYFTPDQVYIVWFVKVLEHWKVLLSTTLLDGMYYECTFNGDKSELYLDAYKKIENVVIDL